MFRTARHRTGPVHLRLGDTMSSEKADRALLTGMLQIAVPLAIGEMRGWSEEARLAKAAEYGQVIVGENGSDILFRSEKKGETAKAFNALARALAALAYHPGGVTFMGQHWCVNHDKCQESDESTRRDAPARRTGIFFRFAANRRIRGIPT